MKLFKKASMVFLLCLLIATPVYASPAGGADQAFDNKIVKRVKTENIYDHVAYLSQVIGSRGAGTEGELETVDYLVDQFRSYGYKDVKVHEFTFPSGGKNITSYNVEAVKEPMKNHNKGQEIIVGAHHDSVPWGPGANDDASGTAALLELARVFADTPTDTTIKFVAFGAEEYGLWGSRRYAEEMTNQEIDNTVAMFQMDMVGSADAGDLVMFTANGEKNTVTDLGAAAGSRVSELVPYSELGRSDHVPFHNLGIPAALFIHTPLEPWYHTEDDLLKYISKEKLKDVSNIVGAAIYQIARKDTPALEKSQVAPVPVDYYYKEPEL
ncbi:M20/M25/M40 family metallo-hydrolase [Virgibacillus halodenitrificans]|uniref:M20/M25/M40 family metallo-hydrolase n=1 Tax=Virgibacillus halodenitrificans TaxID=1482 RepID=UPI001F1EAFDF|nr:M20/M25/M40 family metallo-hydrolase [Virgibacillus halodenitrificans]MCG1027556.1 M20/M25/M40 family metallo-hydrolase [Virgibacillus halodenitrificans]